VDSAIRRTEGVRQVESRPRRPKPKALAKRPAVMEAPAATGNHVLPGRPGDSDQAGTQRGSRAAMLTDDGADIANPEPRASSTDPQVLAAARRIAGCLSIPRPRNTELARRGHGELETLPYMEGADELDIDRTIESLVEDPLLDDAGMFVRERVRAKREIVLAVDASGSMRGERIRTAAAAVGALAGELAKDDVAVLAFWSDAAWLSHLLRPARAGALVEALLGLPTKGLTNVGFPLELAASELANASGPDPRVILLSDCVHNAGPDPRTFAARLPRLDVLLDVTGEHDVELARDLARLGRGQLHPIAHHRGIAPALSLVFQR
jgi:Mg-chelatase subunit ChlD